MSACPALVDAALNPALRSEAVAGGVVAISRETLWLFGMLVAIGEISSLMRKVVFNLLAIKHRELQQKTVFKLLTRQRKGVETPGGLRAELKPLITCESSIAQTVSPSLVFLSRIPGCASGRTGEKSGC